MASYAESEANQRDATRLSAGERAKELPGRHHGSSQSDPIYSSMVVVGPPTPLANEKDLDTIEQVEPSSPQPRAPQDNVAQGRPSTHDVNRTHDVSRRDEYFAGDNVDQLADL